VIQFYSNNATNLYRIATHSTTRGDRVVTTEW